jgi:spermidine synthase
VTQATDSAGTRLIPWRLLCVVVLPASVLMALEIVSSRLLAPVFGNSVYVWGSIISVFLAAMSIGYALGGRVADRRPRLPALGLLLLIAAGSQLGISLIGRWVAQAIGGWSSGRPLGAMVTALLLFGPATVFLSTVAPFAIRLAAHERARLGGLSGGLYALSTIGSLAGTLGATFALVPRLDLEQIFALLTSATAASALVAMGWRQGTRALAALSLLLAVAPWVATPRRALERGAITERITPYQTLMVVEEKGVRSLLSDGVRHGAIVLATGRPALEYAYAAPAAWLLNPRIREVALLGLGSGGVPQLLASRFPQARLEVAEIDPAVLDLATRYFSLPADSAVRVRIADGRRFLEDSQTRWDYVYCDTYVGLAVPFHLATTEFFALVRGRLSEGGVLGINLAGSPSQPFVRAVIRAVHSQFQSLTLLSAGRSGNYLLLARAAREATSEEELSARAAALDGLFPGSPTFAELAKARLEFNLELGDVPLLTDRYAPVDALLHLDAPAASADAWWQGAPRQ